MPETPRQRERTIEVISLAKPSVLLKVEDKLPDDLPTLFSNLRQILLKKSSKNDDEIDSITSDYINSIIKKINELPNNRQPTEIFDAVQATLKLYINDLLPITTCINILSNENFQEIFLSLVNIGTTYDPTTIYPDFPIYARTVCYRAFDLLSLPVITDFLNEKYPSELFTHASYVVRIISNSIQTTIEHVVFKKDDLQNQMPNIRLLIEYIDRHKQDFDHVDMPNTMLVILTLIWALVDDTILVPCMIDINIHMYTIQWTSMKDLSLKLQGPCIHILHNIARHEQGIKVLNDNNCIAVLKEFKQRVLDPNRNNNEDIYVELRLVYCMALSLLTEPKENREDLNQLRKVLDQLMQLAVDAGQSETSKYGGFHVSEVIVVLTKLCVHDEILHYVLNESNVMNMEAKSKIEFFCSLLIKFRGALASENDIDQLTLTALFNIVWSISFHDQYIEELKSSSKFLITVKSLANDDGEALVEQYVPKHMSSILKAANGILWNIDENNPARVCRVTTVPETNQTVQNNNNNNNKTNRIRIMVSYSHADTEFCSQLVESLKKDTRFEVWVDFAFCHTEDFWEEIGEAIEKANVVLFLMSKDYQDSKSCRQEVMYAKDSLKKRFIPIYMKKDFTATGWLGVRIVGPQYIRFGKKTFDETVKELIKLVLDDKKQQETEPTKETKPTVTQPPIIENTDNEKKPVENIPIESNVKLPNKSTEQWTKKDINQWFTDNHIHQELIDLYDFHHGMDLLVYSQCLKSDWQIEYNDMRERYQQKYNTQLYRDQFARLVGAIHRLPPAKLNSRACIIS